MSRKFVYLLTKNSLKFREYQSFFFNYNVEVKVVQDKEWFKDVESLIQRHTHLLENPKAMALLCDETHLFRSKDDSRIRKLGEADDLELVYSRTVLTYFAKGKLHQLPSTAYPGVIDFSAKSSAKKVFGWDDVFVLKSSGLSYQELKNRNMKNHGRQEVLSVFASSFLHFKDNIDLNFNQLDQEGVIEFSSSIFEFVSTNPLINSPSVKGAQLTRLFQFALNNGGFFRSAKNRRQRNYWAPGLNAGIPLVPKKDEIHEITFFVHDLCHFVLPDLIYTGTSTPLLDRVYIIYRMMSEALTLVIADMLFVDALAQDGIEYNFAKRKIYPLYQAIKEQHPELPIKELWQANVRYCLLGDDSGYVKLIAPEALPVLEQFKAKYGPFFVEDFKWTQRNLENMQQNAAGFQNWYTDNQALFKAQNLYSIEGFVTDQLDLEVTQTVETEALVELIFEKVSAHYLSVMHADRGYSVEERLSNSFKKYMLGQMLLLYRIDFIPYALFLREKIQQKLQEPELDLADISRIRALYTDFVTFLEAEYHLINQDDRDTFKEVYPIFDSFYVFYDAEKGAPLSLKEASQQALQ